MKTLLQTAAVFVLMTATAFASKWTPNGGTATDPAPRGDYKGKVSRVVSGDTVTWKITTAAGVLEIDNGEKGLSDEEEKALTIAEQQNDDNNTVKIDKNGSVESVATG